MADITVPPTSGSTSSTSTPSSGKPSTSEDDLKYLRDNRTEDKEETKEVDDDESKDYSEEPDDEVRAKDGREEEDEESEESEEGAGEGENEEEIVDEPTLVTVKGIKKEFPEFFKKHPEMRGVIHRERQFSEIYATPEEAQTASVKADTLDRIESDLFSGEPEALLKVIKKNTEEGYNKLLSNLLPTLQRVDETGYHKVAEVILKRALRAAAQRGQQQGNTNLEWGAQYVHQLFFDDDPLEAKAEFEKEFKAKSPEQERYERKTMELEQRDHSTFKSGVDSDFINGVEQFFSDGLDPDNLLSDWTKKKMFEDCLIDLNRQMVADPRHMRNVEGIWKQARGSGYNSEFKSRIVTASLARAKQIIPAIRQKLRQEAMTERRKRLSNGNNPRKNEMQGSNKRPAESKGKIDLRNTAKLSDLDIIRGRQ